LRHRRQGYVGAGGFLYAGMYAYVAGTPFAYITYYHVPAQHYGLLFGLAIIGIMGANILNSRLVPRFGYDRMLWIGAFVAAASAIMTALAACTGWGGLWGLVAPLFVFVSSTGLVVANSITGALADFPERAGSVSALTGALQYGSGIMGSGLAGFFSDGTPWPMGWVIGVSGIGCLLSIALLVPARVAEPKAFAMKKL
jgi:MFS transporter, DHA1 family, multidrug resistance protein